MNREIYNRNMEALTKRYKAVNLELPSTEEEEDLQAEVSSVEGKQVLYVTKGEEVYQLDSLYNSEELLRDWFLQIKNWNFQSRFLLFGFGNGMYVNKLLKETEDEKKTRIIVYEPSKKIFLKVLEELDISEMISTERVLLSVDNCGMTDVKYFMENDIVYENINGTVRRDYLNYKELFPKSYKVYTEAVSIVINAIGANQDVSKKFGEAYYNNTFYNYRFMAGSKSIYSLYESLPPELPAIIVSAGPSLDKNIMDLKAAKGRSLIIAVDTSVMVLLKNGITPDIFVSIDGMKTIRHFQDERIKDVPLMCNLISNREVLELHTGDKFFVNDFDPYVNEFFTERLIELPLVVGGGSVATDAFVLAERLQRETIILVGQDLAYTGNRGHSVQATWGAWDPDIYHKDVWHKEMIDLEGIDGEPVKSSYEFQLYLDWFEREIAANRKAIVIDATEGGAMIHGAINMKLKDAVEKHCTKEAFDIEGGVKRTNTLLNMEMQKEFLEYMGHSSEEMRTLQKLICKGIREYEKMYLLAKTDKYHGKEMKRLLYNVNEINEAVKQTPVFYYIDLRTQDAVKEILEDIYQTEKDEKAEIVASIKEGLDYYKILNDKLTETIPDTEKRIMDAEEKLAERQGGS